MPNTFQHITPVLFPSQPSSETVLFPCEVSASAPGRTQASPEPPLLVSVLPAPRTRPMGTPPAEIQTMIPLWMRTKPMSPRHKLCSKQPQVYEEAARERTRHRKQRKKEKICFFFPNTTGGHSRWPKSLRVRALYYLLTGELERATNLAAQPPPKWPFWPKHPGRSQSSEGLSGCRAPSHTWVCAAPSSWGRKLRSDIKQSVSITVPETAGMMSGPHKGSG